MRVITGTAGGRKLEQLVGDDVRPTTDRVKEAVFSIIQFDIEGRRFLDLFAGSGQMGIEALSRGAKEAVFVDNRRESIAIVKRNLAATKLADNAKVVQMDSVSYLNIGKEKFDFLFLDPPYGTGLLQAALSKAEAVMNKGGLILCESPVAEELPDVLGEFVKYREYKHGKIKITSYCHEDFADNKKPGIGVKSRRQRG